MLTPLRTCNRSVFGLFTAVHSILLVLVPLRAGLPSFFSLSFTHIHCNFWQLPWNIKSWHWLPLVAEACRGLCHGAREISLLSSTTVSVQQPHGALACRSLPFILLRLS